MDLPFYDPYQSRYQEHATDREFDLTLFFVRRRSHSDAGSRLHDVSVRSLQRELTRGRQGASGRENHASPPRPRDHRRIDGVIRPFDVARMVATTTKK
jgi:hypothetical protein